ncbi:uncharacterized protein BDZ99DRAFT_434264 [Mytilinidion resinicola]|uniref:Arylsulfotransferase n=1 Tax=Mytilinidion resinicola TaxID=574789 RepID=A0A6A6Z077_9PEZI|nr:uncharacterized protein BDZ99DRAFT_434264 [Mytilinidion resinicola]KAF2814562.1 hypothetical protein BDZ99DRAFT_434264 [Mytilinidion resinicola]
MFSSLARIPQLTSLFSLLIITTFFSPATANWKYKSRPDLSPPTLNITTPATFAISPGYIFVAPYSFPGWDPPLPHGPLQPGPYIFTSSGELVWSGFGYISGYVANFQAANWKGEEVLFAFEGSLNGEKGHGHGHATILNGSYESIKQVRGAGSKVLDVHEFQVLDERTAVVEIYRPTPFELKKFGAGPRSQWIVDAVFQDIEIETGRLLFEWSSLDHVPPEESVYSIASLAFGTGYNSSDALDYFHINSVDRDADHNYLVSGRHTSTIYKINGTSGAIIWRLGGRHSNFTLAPGVAFSFQHHARFISHSKEGDIEIISLFDNSGPELNGKRGEYANESSGKLLSLNTTSWTAALIQDFPAPHGVFAVSQGNTQILPNGNAFVSWGSAGAITEYSPDGTVIFHAYLESGDLWANGNVQNYRGFRFNWTGVPHEDPAVVALRHGESTVVYVSWNGDTETDVWAFYGVDAKGREIIVGEKKREGFETSFYVWSGKKWSGFFAEAVGKDGKVKRRSTIVRPEKYIYKYVPGRDDLVYQQGLDEL